MCGADSGRKRADARPAGILLGALRRSKAFLSAVDNDIVLDSDDGTEFALNGDAFCVRFLHDFARDANILLEARL